MPPLLNSEEKTPTDWGARLFRPILAGATLRERATACLGAVVGISTTAVIGRAVLGEGVSLPFLVAPMGASSVLLFAVPASPMAQPWTIVGGNVISALVGVVVARFVHDPLLASGLAVGLAIGAMSLTRCLHPPGGAAALTAVLGGPTVEAAGLSFPFLPVGLNALALTLIGIVFHRLTWRAYPHVPAPTPAQRISTADLPPQVRIGFREQDIDAALSDLGETLDIDRRDLDRLLRQVERRALERSHGKLVCADIMSRDVVSVRPDATVASAQALLAERGVRLLPAVDDQGRLRGVVGARELSRAGRLVADVMIDAPTAAPDSPALLLIDPLTDEINHAAVVVDPEAHVLGLVTQTDLLAALARWPSGPGRA